MKVCPQCKQRYPSESSFCFVDGATLVPLQDERIGMTLAGRYVLDDVIGEGGMAIVYRARHKLVDRPCAVKILQSEVLKEPNVRERFRREARHAQRLAHPNIIEVFDHGETEDAVAYIVMELLVGQSLAEVVSRGKVPVKRFIDLSVQMVRALARAHDFEVIHRDLKPENVFVLKGDRIKLLDFGIARSNQDSRLTSVGEIFGTPEYMAPEQGTSQDAGPSADLYSLGVIFFEMLTGRLPYEAANPPTLLVKHISDPIPHMKEREASIPDVLDALVFGLMSKSPAERPVDAHAVLAELMKAAETLGITIPEETEIDAPPASTQLKPAKGNWEARTKLFGHMLERGFAPGPPADLSRMLGEIQQKVEAVTELKNQAFVEQQKLEIIESEGREGRVRFGQAMDTLSVDGSRMRSEVRSLRASLAPMLEEKQAFIATLMTAHRNAVFWEGRSAFTEPYAELSLAYRELAGIVDEWLAVRKREQSTERSAQELESQLVDVEYQIKELRTGLEAHDKDLEERMSGSQSSIAEMGRRAEALESELLLLATRFCAPLRAKPELVPLFRQLEAGG